MTDTPPTPPSFAPMTRDQLSADLLEMARLASPGSALRRELLSAAAKLCSSGQNTAEFPVDALERRRDMMLNDAALRDSHGFAMAGLFRAVDLARASQQPPRAA